MSIALEIPAWVIWVGGTVVGIVVLALAVVGAIFIHAMKDFRPFG